MTRAAILDQREIWATGVASIIEECGFQLIGAWSDPRAAMSVLIDNPPDILILSAALIQQSAASEIGKIDQRPAIVLIVEPGEMLTRDELGEFPFEGLLIRDTPAKAAANCLKTVAAGHAWIDPNILGPSSESGRQYNWTCLTSRELEVANLAARGLSNKRIAKTLHLSDGTVKMHMHHILNKLHVGRRSDLSGTVPNIVVAAAEGSRKTTAN